MNGCEEAVKELPKKPQIKPLSVINNIEHVSPTVGFSRFRLPE